MIKINCQRTSRPAEETLGLLNYRHAYFVLLSLILSLLYYRYAKELLWLKPSHNITFNSGSLFLLCVHIPSRLVWWFSVGCTFAAFKLDQYKRLPRCRDFGRFIICLVTRGENVESVRRIAFAMRNYKSLHQRIEFHVLAEGATVHAFGDLREDIGAVLHGVPTDYMPKKAKFKARALEWFRTSQKLQNDDWILHLDEETYVDNYGIRTCLDVIERSPDISIAQGMIFYNFHNYWKNWVTTWVDSLRVVDDFGRFQWQFNHYHRPVFGMHGAFLLIRGEVENSVTWETGNLTEDCWFSIQADRLGYKFGWIPAIAREQSPITLKDLIAQRRRWSQGLWTLNERFTTFLVVCWVWQSMKLLCWASIVFFGFPKLIPSWLYLVLCIDSSTSLSVLSWGILLQDYDAYIPWWLTLWHQLWIPVMAPLVSVIHAVPVLIGILRPPKTFHVIRK